MSEATQDLIGKLLRNTAQRDAIHIAVAPVVAREMLTPGQRIGLVDGQATTAVEAEKLIGVVDPFLPGRVLTGQRFFMFLYPNTITGLRHEWTHKAFAADPAKAESEAWLRNFANRYSGNYEEMVAAALSGDSYCFGDEIEYEDFYENAEFWTHIEVVSGKHLDRDERQNNNHFRCAC